MSALPTDLRRRFRSAIEAAEFAARLTYRLGTIEALTGQTNGAIYLIGVGALFDAFPFLARKWADDPPRDDFESVTRIARRTIREEAPLAETGDAVTDLAARLVVDIDETNRHLRAALRAFERMQGALLRGSPAASRRGLEAKEFRSEAGYALESTGARLQRLVPAIQREPTRWFEEAEAPELRMPDEPQLGALAPRRLKEPGVRPKAPQDLPAGTLAGLYLLGIPISELTRTVQRRGSALWQPDRTIGYARALKELGRELRSWEPKPET
jgi:hypothetical protein